MSKIDFADLEAEKVIPLELKNPQKMTVQRLTTLSAETVRRRYAEFVIDLSPGRQGMKVRKALEIADGKA